MKLLIASDIHGDIAAAEAIKRAYFESGADRLILLGDLLYHGPRNDLPASYAPKMVIELLNGMSEHLLCVRGNCDTEVDQMVLSFPILADYALVECDGVRMLLTHGHKFNMQTPPPLGQGDVLLNGHTHVATARRFGNDNLYINPGSPSIPKENTPKGYIIYGNRTFDFVDLDGKLWASERVDGQCSCGCI